MKSALGMRWVAPVGVLVLVVPWLAFAWTLPHRSVPTLVAVPAQGPGLAAPVATAFEQAPYFVVVETATLRAETIPNPYRSSGSLGIKAAHRLVAAGVGVLVTPDLRAAPHNALRSRGVRLYAAQGGTVSDVVQQFARGALDQVTTPPRGIAPNPPTAGALPPPAAPVEQGLRTLRVSGLGLEVASGPRGILVVAVAPQSPADRAGIQAGDVITGLNRVSMTDAAHFRQFAALLPTNRQVPLGLERQGVPGEIWISP